LEIVTSKSIVLNLDSCYLLSHNISFFIEFLQLLLGEEQKTSMSIVKEEAVAVEI